MTPAVLQTAVRCCLEHSSALLRKRGGNGVTGRLKVERYPAELLWTNFLLDAGPALKLDPALGMTRGL